MQTATSVLDQERDAKNERMLELYMEQFWKRWAPDDKYEAAQFHAELHSLVRQIYRDAQEPLIKQWTAVIAAMPLFPTTTVIPKDQGK